MIVPVGTSSDGRTSWPSLGDLGSGDIDALLGLDEVLAAVDVDASSVESLHERRDTDVSLDGRRRYVRSAVARLKAEKARTRADQPGRDVQGGGS